MHNDSLSAVVGAVSLGIMGFLMTGWAQTTLIAASLALSSAIAAYGFTWGLWTTASDYLTTDDWSQGLVLGCLAALSLCITVNGLAESWRSAAILQPHHFVRRIYPAANLSKPT